MLSLNGQDFGGIEGFSHRERDGRSREDLDDGLDGERSVVRHGERGRGGE